MIYGEQVDLKCSIHMYMSLSKLDDLVAVVDVSSSTNPVLVSTIEPPSRLYSGMDDPYDIAVSGSYAYVDELVRDSLAILDIGALEVSNMEAGNIKTDNLEVQGKAQFDQDVLAHGSLNVGHNALIGGALSITGTASSTLLGGNHTSLNVTSGNAASVPYCVLANSPYGEVAPQAESVSLKS